MPPVTWPEAAVDWLDPVALPVAPLLVDPLLVAPEADDDVDVELVDADEDEDADVDEVWLELELVAEEVEEEVPLVITPLQPTVVMNSSWLSIK